MADIFKLVDYDVTAPVVIHHDAEQGDVVFNVRSIDNPETAAILKRRQAKSMGARVSRKDDTALSDEDVGMMMLDAINPDSEALAPCIVSWEWNGHEFGELGVDPELTPENVRRVLDVPWIKAKVQAGVQSIQVFSESVTDSFVSYARNWVKYETTNPRYEAEHGSGDYLTTREAMERAGREVPDYQPSPDMRYLLADFWNLKRYLPELAAPITPGLVRDYMECQGALLTRAERAIIYATDYALRGALADQIAKNERWKMKQARKK